MLPHQTVYKSVTPLGLVRLEDFYQPLPSIHVCILFPFLVRFHDSVSGGGHWR